jgi:hypothetical protein
MGKKGKKSIGGEGEMWDEPKSQTVSLRLTATGKERLAEQAKQLNISQSELVERYLRGVAIPPPVSGKDREFLLDLQHNPSFSTVMESLPRFSIKQIIQLGMTCFEYLMTHFGENTEDLFEGKDLENFAEESRIPQERLLEIRDGVMPTPDEITKLARVFQVRPAEMKQRFEERKEKQGNGC